MKASTDRILTTHVGSLIRTREIIEGMKARTLHKPYDADALDLTIRDGIREVVRKQVEIGIDIPNDGEFARRGFTAYIHERLGGIQARALETGERNPLDQVGHQLERAAFREFYEQHDRLDRFMWMLPGVAMDEMVDVRGKSEVFRVTGAITYTGAAHIARDIDNLRSALDGLEVTDAFITAVTPTTATCCTTTATTASTCMHWRTLYTRNTRPLPTQALFCNWIARRRIRSSTWLATTSLPRWSWVWKSSITRCAAFLKSGCGRIGAVAVATGRIRKTSR